MRERRVLTFARGDGPPPHGTRVKHEWFHAASSIRLRCRTCSCRSARSKAVLAVSSNRTGKKSNGYCVTHARAAASLAARDKGPPLRALPSASKRSESNRALSRSNSASCRARNGAAGLGLTSNPVSEPNWVGTDLFFLFMFLPFLSAAGLGRPCSTKNPRLPGNRGLEESTSLISQFPPRRTCSAATGTSVPSRAGYPGRL
jgi:hypothetical protein